MFPQQTLPTIRCHKNNVFVTFTLRVRTVVFDATSMLFGQFSASENQFTMSLRFLPCFLAINITELFVVVIADLLMCEMLSVFSMLAAAVSAALH